MKLYFLNIGSNVKEAWLQFYQHWIRTLSASLIDIGFFFGFFVIQNYLFLKIYPLIDPFLSYVSENTETIALQLTDGESILSLYTKNYPVESSMIVNYLIFGSILVILLFCLSQTFGWLLIHNPKNKWNFVKKFATASFFQILLLISVVLLFSWLIFQYSATPLGNILVSILYGLIVCLLILMVISFSIVNKPSPIKNSLITLAKKPIILAINIVIWIVSYFLINYILIQLIKIHYLVFLIGGIILIFPTITFLKILCIKTLN